MNRFTLMLTALLVTKTNLLISQCTPPSNQPTNLSFPGTNQTSIIASFNAAAGGAVQADGYLVLLSTSSTLTQQPVDGIDYSGSSTLGNAKIISTDNKTSVQASTLNPSTTYYLFVFSATSGHCYSLTSPLNGSVTTLPAPGGSGQSSESNNQDPSKSSELAALLNFNFVGNNNAWSNFTPFVFYGWSKTGNVSTGKGSKNHHLMGSTFQVGPYVGTTIAIKDSTSFLPALMLPGNAGLELNYYMTFGREDKFSVVVSPILFGLKVISGFTDTTLALVQHNIRHAIGIRYQDYLTVSVQYTTGWHSTTTNSEENFKKIFVGSANSRISYWNVEFTTKLSNDLFGGQSKSPLYLQLNWRSLSKPSDHFNLPNSRFITIGLTTTLDLKSGSNPGFAPKAPHL